MKSSAVPIQTELVLVGGGHANIQVLKSFGMRPISGLRITQAQLHASPPLGNAITHGGHTARHLGRTANRT